MQGGWNQSRHVGVLGQRARQPACHEIGEPCGRGRLASAAVQHGKMFHGLLIAQSGQRAFRRKVFQVFFAHLCDDAGVGIRGMPARGRHAVHNLSFGR